MNKKQKEAVKYTQGPLLIIAGAGTGKTLVITEKIKYLIEKGLAKPEEILALTFTEKASLEMEERVDKALPYGYFPLWINTFHSFADKILKQEGVNIGLNPAFKLMNKAETLIFFKKNLFLFNLKYFRPLGNPDKFIDALLIHFSRLKDEFITPQQYLNWVNNLKKNQKTDLKKEYEKYLELALTYQKFQELKLKEGVLDFSDLVYYLLKLFLKRPNLLNDYQKKFKYVLIDEFQDTNIAQYELIKLLCPAKKNPRLTVVGDDSQSIYKFRGASISNILNFINDYPLAKTITLNKNYRSNQTILDSAYCLITNNNPNTLEAQLGISKKLIAQGKDNKKAIKFILAQTAEEEANTVAKEILKLNKKYSFSQIAILSRANNHLEVFARALSRLGIPFQFLGGGMLYKQPEIKDLIAYLKTLYNLQDSVSLFRVLSMNIFSLDARDLNMILNFAKKINHSLFEAIEIYLSFFYKDIFQEDFQIYQNILPFIKKQTREKIFDIYQMIKRHLALIKKATAGQILYYFLEDSNYLPKLANFKTEREEKIALNINKFFNRLKIFEAEHEDASVSSVVEFLEMSMQLGESPLENQVDYEIKEAVNLLTVHSAKGLEFPVVFLVNLTSSRFPTYERKEPIPLPDALIKEILPTGDYHLQEERRLFYVAMTRAKEKLYLTAARFYAEGKREQKISIFVKEALGEKILEKTKNNLKQKKEISYAIADFKEKSKEAGKEKLSFKTFSYSQLETYLRCPLQYKYQYLLNIPTPPQAATSFGTTIHQTLQQFYQVYQKNPAVDHKKLLEIYYQKWIPLGYSSSIHERRMKKEGEAMLLKFYENFHTKDIKIIDLEKLFKLKIGPGIIISGKIDRVDLLNNNKIEIIDYKTGKIPQEKEIKNSLQLSIYALAAKEPLLYNKRLSQIKLTFYFLDETKKISLEPKIDQINKVKEKIKEVVKKIKEDTVFPPQVGVWCDFCPFKMICEAWQ